MKIFGYTLRYMKYRNEGVVLGWYKYKNGSPKEIQR